MAIIIKDRDQFQEVFREYYSALCNFAYRYLQDRDLCEDTVQAVFIRIWEKRESIQLTGSIQSYLYTATRNSSLDYIRSKKRQEKYFEENPNDDVELPVEDESTSKLAFRGKLQKAIADLKPKTKEIFLLHKIEGLTYKEISEHLKIPKRTVEYNIYSALSQLKTKLQADYEKYVAI